MHEYRVSLVMVTNIVFDKECTGNVHESCHMSLRHSSVILTTPELYRGLHNREDGVGMVEVFFVVH